MNFLEVLDNHYKDYTFLYLENANFDYVTAKLDVFVENEDWLLVFQVIGIDQEGPQTNLYYYSNTNPKNFGLVTLDTIDIDSWSYEGLPKENLFSGKITILNQVYNYAFNASTYTQKNIQLVDEASYPTYLLRMIKETMDPLFFINKEEILEVLDQDGKWNYFYSTDCWQHTEVGDIPPSQNIFFKSLEQALITKNPTFIQLGESNVHWLNWVDYDFEKQIDWDFSEYE
ncbi:hypothetical protein ABH966_000827 [Lysinibacillus sp. RC46]|uniref:DUF7003 family protein n=1 Tax=Lysinibacillus sp. RC46 TaxID=3156295 RepID=UPI00351879C3